MVLVSAARPQASVIESRQDFPIAGCPAEAAIFDHRENEIETDTLTRLGYVEHVLISRHVLRTRIRDDVAVLPVWQKNTQFHLLPRKLRLAWTPRACLCSRLPYASLFENEFRTVVQ